MSIWNGSYGSGAANTQNKFKLRVTSVDHNETLDDNQVTPKLHVLGGATMRNLHISGWRMDGVGMPHVSVVVPVPHLGDFKIPQPGDVVTVEFSQRAGANEYARLVDAEYDDVPAELGGNPVPQWGSFPGDYGTLRTFKHHNVSMSSQPDGHEIPNVPKSKDVNFRTVYTASITGERFRRFYKGNTKPGKFVLRGDSVFDIDPQHMVREVVIEDGVDLMEGQGIKDDSASYPNPLNVPQEFKEDKHYKYEYRKHQYLDKKLTSDPFEEGYPQEIKYEDTVFVMNNRYFTSYEPVMDKTYREKIGFERELPAVDEKIIALKGNNKLVFQDVHGDGKQLVTLLKNLYDAGLAIIHSDDRGQVRLRDHLGNIILLDANPDRPRTVIMTPERQAIDMGSYKDKGSYMYMRSGDAWGDSELEWGRKTGKTQDTVFNQEFLMVSSNDVIEDSDFTGKLSSGLAGILVGPGIYQRTVDDEEGKYEKNYASYEKDNKLVEQSVQRWNDTNTEVVLKTEIPDSGSDAIWEMKSLYNGKKLNKVRADKSAMLFERFVANKDEKMGYIQLDDERIIVDTETKFRIDIGAKSQNINIGNSKAVIGIESDAAVWRTKSIDITSDEATWNTKSFDFVEG